MAITPRRATVTAETTTEFVIEVPLIVQGVNVKTKLDSLDSTAENLSQRVVVLEISSGQLGDYVPTSRTVNNHALTSNITITKSDLGLSNVDNTSDSSKPVSTLQTAADAAVLASANAYTDSQGGGTHTSGTFTSRPVSPSAGDTYVVTSGENIGDYYQCFITNTWELLGYDHAPLAPSCVARWKLEDYNSSTIVDSKDTYNLSYGYTPASTYQGQPSPWKTCMAFDENIPVADAIHGASSLIPADISVLAWVCRYGGTGSGAYIILKRQAASWGGLVTNNAAFALYISAAHRFNLYIIDTIGKIKSVQAPIFLATPVGKWVRVAGTYNVATGLKLYLDGRLVGSDTGGHPINYVDNYNWAIGSNYAGSGVSATQGFNGFIRDVQICNAVLTPTQILEDYERGLGIKRFTVEST